MAIQIRVVFEVMGWPEEALNLSLKKTLEMLRNSGWKITKEDYAKPEKVSEKMYSSFLEFDAQVPKLQDLFGFVLSFAPSVVEVLSPPEFDINAGEMQDMLADICAKVQDMDKDIKMLAAKNRMLSDHIKKHESEKEPENSSD